jgi:hypothetical protein
MGDDGSDPSNPSIGGSPPDQTTTDKPLDPNGIAQFVEHDRCQRYLKQHADPGEESEARDWRKAFCIMNIALLRKGAEFEADQLEALAANATRIIAPEVVAFEALTAGTSPRYNTKENNATSYCNCPTPLTYGKLTATPRWLSNIP